MNRLPCARLITPMTPNTSVRPLLMRNNSSPYCKPFRTCAKRPVRSMESPGVAGSGHAAAGAGVGQRLRGDADHAVLPALRFPQIDVLHRVVGRRQGEGAARAV